MIQYTFNLLNTIKKDVQTIDLEEGTTLNKSLKIIELLKTYFNELKEHISEYTFNSDDEEIQFFKETKPQIFCMLIYYDNIYRMEISRPTGSESMRKAFTLKQFDELKEYFDNNIDFYRYCRSQRTDLDKQYFLRYQPDVETYFDSQYFERDQKFSTGFDLKVATILANEMLSNYLNAELNKGNQSISSQIVSAQPVNIKWTGSKVAFIELMYAVNITGSINNGKIDLKGMTKYAETIFNIDLGDVYRTFIEIRGRKGSRVQYLDKLRKNIITRMDEADSL